MTSCIYRLNVLILCPVVAPRGCCRDCHSRPCSSRAWVPSLHARFDNTAEQQVAHFGVIVNSRASTHDDQRLLTRGRSELMRTHRTACTTSVMTVLVGISSLSTPGKPSARVGPTLRYSTGLRNSSACFNKLTYELRFQGFPKMA
jgi:hypothetical protein